ncbi:MAG: hypothetical protein JWO93_2713 [Micrococcaceae bacterium]|nr:hypothetical protein [Micrococcaceae bacterium]
MGPGWLPPRVLRPRGWGLLAAGALSLLFAAVMGRRDLLTLALFLLILPLLAIVGSRLLKPALKVYREFSPPSVETEAAVTVTLAIHGNTARQVGVALQEQLPTRFGEPPTFSFPSRTATFGGVSRYAYRLRSTHRGQFRVGPVTAEFSDPFGLTRRRHQLDDGDLLTVTPAALDLPGTQLTGSRGSDGSMATPQKANPSEDDAMTREYRSGDPMRRVHWRATARHGQLMVRQEESVTTPDATLILDSRTGAFTTGHTGFPLSGQEGRSPSLHTTEGFEWLVVAAMSISAHLVERGFSLRILDPQGLPGLARSASAPWPQEEHYSGSSGLQAVAESLAALELQVPAHQPLPVSGRTQKIGSPRTGPSGSSGPAAGGSTAGASQHGAALSEHLLSQLAAHRHRGPIVALLGRLSVTEARLLAPAADYAAGALAILVLERPQEATEVLEVLRSGGWRATAVNRKTSLASAWASFDEGASGSILQSAARSGGQRTASGRGSA